MAISDKDKEITDIIYRRYGSGTGILFGIPPALRHSVEAIVSVTLQIAKEQEEIKERR